MRERKGKPLASAIAAGRVTTSATEREEQVYGKETRLKSNGARGLTSLGVKPLQRAEPARFLRLAKKLQLLSSCPSVLAKDGWGEASEAFIRLFFATTVYKATLLTTLNNSVLVSASASFKTLITAKSNSI